MPVAERYSPLCASCGYRPVAVGPFPGPLLLTKIAGKCPPMVRFFLWSRCWPIITVQAMSIFRPTDVKYKLNMFNGHFRNRFLEVPTIHGRPKFQRIYRQNIAKNMIQYLHFRILGFPLIDGPRPRWCAMVVTKAARKRSRTAPAASPRVLRRRVTSKRPESEAPVEWRGCATEHWRYHRISLDIQWNLDKHCINPGRKWCSLVVCYKTSLTMGYCGHI